MGLLSMVRGNKAAKSVKPFIDTQDVRVDEAIALMVRTGCSMDDACTQMEILVLRQGDLVRLKAVEHEMQFGWMYQD